MSDAIVKREGNWVKSFIDGAGDAVRGSIKKVDHSGVGPYLRGGGSALLQMTEGVAVGATLGAAKARFGVDASAGMMASAAAVAVFSAGFSPTLSSQAANVAGQAAAVMAARRAEAFVSMWAPPAKPAVAAGAPAGQMKAVGPAPGVHGDGGGDRIIQTAARIAQRQQQQQQ